MHNADVINIADQTTVRQHSCANAEGECVCRASSRMSKSIHTFHKVISCYKTAERLSRQFIGEDSRVWQFERIAMNFRLAVIFLVVVVGISAKVKLTAEDEEKVFEDYVKRFSLRRGRTSSVSKMRENVVRRYKEVLQHNERFETGQSSFAEELNKFSYMSAEELAATSLGFRGNETSSYSAKGEVNEIFCGLF
jgi:hypothetical protein